MTEYWNRELETRPWAEVERWQAEQVTAMLPALRRRSRLYARLHAGVANDLAVHSAADLAALPFTLKDDAGHVIALTPGRTFIELPRDASTTPK